MKRLAAIVACVLTVGCASAFLLTQEDVTPKQRYFALVSDYTDAKKAALPVMKSEHVSREVKEKILKVVRETDDRINRFEAFRKSNAGELPDNQYEVVNAIIAVALEDLLKYGVQLAYAGLVLILLQILTVVAKHYGLDESVQQLVFGSITKLKGFIDRGEEPTEEDFAELFAASAAATDALEAAFAESEGVDSPTRERSDLEEMFDRIFDNDGESG